MKERPILFNGAMVRAILDGSKTQTRRVVKQHPLIDCGMSDEYIKSPENYVTKDCPFGQPGDRLWVRESFWGCDLPGYGDQPCVVYDDEWSGKEYAPTEARPWARKFGRIPSIHMPRDCSRITLEITGVRVERLQDISEDDCRAEGCAGGHGSIPGYQYSATPSEHFQYIWKSTGGNWDANPWVWVPEFRRITP